MNSVMRAYTDYKSLRLPELVKRLEMVINHQMLNEKGALHNNGMYSLDGVYRRYIIPAPK